jgi:DNA-binding MarR family transcriptional regulator
MQSTTVLLPDSRSTVIDDMYALASFLMRTSNVGAFNTVAELDLSFTQIKTLCSMDLGDSQPSVKQLAQSMNVSLPTMSRAVDGLFERGFVERREDPADRRMKRIALTHAGRAVTGTLNEVRLQAMRGFLTSLNDEETEALAHALSLILESRTEIAALRPPEKGVIQ